MGEEAEGGVDASGGSVTVHVRCSNGNKFSLAVDLASTVRDLKMMLVERSEIPADQQRLIYKGRVLKDESSLDSYGLQHDHTVHLVRGAPASTTPASSATAVPTSPAQVPAAAAPAANSARLGVTTGPGGNGLGFPNLGGFGAGGGAGFSEFQQVQEQLMQNPNLMREMMNMPAVQNLMNNPDLMRTLIMSNPQMRDIIDRNPDLAQILNDPGTLRQTLDAARNPELMREMMRNTDRAMSNIEASPEGFNMLRRMYETVQEPLLNAATMGGEGGNDLASNPFAAFLGSQGVTQGRSQTLGTNNTAGTQLGTGTTVPNTAPLPNPWNPSATGAGAGGVPTSQPPAGTAPTAVPGGGLPNLGGLPGLGLPDLGSLGAGGMLDPSTMQQMLQNPQIQQMMQGLLSNPQYMSQIMQMQPHLRSLLNQNPHFREMLQSPDFIRQISSPESLQELMQLQQAMSGQRQGRHVPGQAPGQTGTGMGGNPNLDISSLLGMFGGLGTVIGNTPEVNTVAPEQLYASQLSQLQEMGFLDTQENVRALVAVGGNVNAAVERLLGNLQ
ncbi:unnamed protein product [Sphagnum troendelagicum]|uniref:Ubiquilin n=1 Tax=Sphagnum troendelagicum TaxID=128251 RepID=A0ABP0US31_9BRYO